MSKSKIIVNESVFGTRRLVAFITPGEKIEIHAFTSHSAPSVTVLKIGDRAEYDSYNLRYLGPIMGITAKSVIVRKGPSSCASTKRMKIEEFAWRNWDFSVEQANRDNAEASMNI